MHVTIETERIVVRELTTHDALFMLELMNTDGWITNIGDRNIHNLEDATHYISKILATEGFYYQVFELKLTKQPIGIITFLYRTGETLPDIGFATLPTHQKLGYTFEAAKAYLAYLLAKNPQLKLVGITIPSNTASQQLLKKLGLVLVDEITNANNEKLLRYISH